MNERRTVESSLALEVLANWLKGGKRRQRERTRKMGFGCKCEICPVKLPGRRWEPRIYSLLLKLTSGGANLESVRHENGAAAVSQNSNS